jgi:hypothetical protein
MVHASTFPFALYLPTPLTPGPACQSSVIHLADGAAWVSLREGAAETKLSLVFKRKQASFGKNKPHSNHGVNSKFYK